MTATTQKGGPSGPLFSSPLLHTIQVPIDKIQVGDRHRKDMGDIDALAVARRDAEIAADAWLEPLVKAHGDLPAEQLVAKWLQREAAGGV